MIERVHCSCNVIRGVIDRTCGKTTTLGRNWNVVQCNTCPIDQWWSSCVLRRTLSMDASTETGRKAGREDEPAQWTRRLLALVRCRSARDMSRGEHGGHIQSEKTGKQWRIWHTPSPPCLNLGQVPNRIRCFKVVGLRQGLGFCRTHHYLRSIPNYSTAHIGGAFRCAAPGTMNGP